MGDWIGENLVIIVAAIVFAVMAGILLIDRFIYPLLDDPSRRQKKEDKER